MFPTKGKSKIPRTLAYPLNAKMISEALVDVPQAKELSLDFSFYSTSASRLKTQIFPVLYISYSHWEVNRFMPHSFEKRGGNQPQWRITIEPVPIIIKHHVQELLQLQSFPKAHNWLCERSHPTGTQKVLSLRILYNQDFDRLEYQEHSHS